MGKKTCKVLVVDDDEAISEALCMLLEVEGFLAVTADYFSFFEVVAAEQPSLILLDVWLSGFDGSLLCKKLKEDKKFSNTPVLLISASKDIQKRAEFAGADGYIEKPFNIEDIVKKMQPMLS